MASFQPQIIQLPTQQPFNALQNPIINAYASAMMKNKFEDMAEQRKAERQAMAYEKAFGEARQRNPEALIEESFSPTGKSFSIKPEKEPSMLDAYVGNISDTQAKRMAGRMGVSRGTLPPESVPGAAMSMASGGYGDIEENPLSSEERYQDAVKRALRSEPGLSQNARIARDERQASLSIPETFKSDLQKAMVDAQDDEDALLDSLSDLRVKYADNPTAFKQLSALIKEHVSSAGSSKLSIK